MQGIISNLPKEEIIKRYKDGESSYYIANDFNISQKTVINWLKKIQIITTLTKKENSYSLKVINNCPRCLRKVKVVGR